MVLDLNSVHVFVFLLLATSANLKRCSAGLLYLTFRELLLGEEHLQWFCKGNKHLSILQATFAYQ